MNPSTRIKNEALRLGFDLAGIAPATPSRHAGAVRDWLAAGHHGEMGWLARDPERRLDPGRVVPGARSVISVGLSYAVAEPPAGRWDDPLCGRVARYAWGPDYHDVLLPMLMELGRFVEAEAGRPVAWRAYVDTGPVLEREVAARAGLGFVGRNTLLVAPTFGSFLFLGEILTDLELEPDAPAEQAGAAWVRDGKVAGCGACHRCLEACPTHAFPAAYVLNSRRCISYLTIEHRGAIPEELRPLMKNWIYGCDECQTVCPWVKQFAQPGKIRFLSADPDRAAPRLLELLALDDAAFRERFRGTPVLRTKRRGLLRNVCVALGNSGSPAAIPALEHALNDPEPLLREHARWALQRLANLPM
jgi:epoxyqueuosine reductase